MLTLRFNLGTDFRFPSLSESYFFGTTPRGRTIGNPDLNPEFSYQGELAADYQAQYFDLQFQVYRQFVDDYIERIDIGNDTLSYKNLSRAEIYGFEVVIDGHIGDHLEWLLSGQWNKGEDDNGEYLADITPQEWLTEWRYSLGEVGLGAVYRYRVGTDDVASPEQAIEDAHLLSLSALWEINHNWSVSLWGKNLLNEQFLLTKDDKSSFGFGRQIGASISYSGQ